MKLKHLKGIGLVCSITAALIATAVLSRNTLGQDAAASAPKPRPAPSWTLQNLDGKTVRSADFKGKVVILDFWATWCPPCRAEIPGLIALQKQYGPQGLAVVGVSVNQDGVAGVKSFARKKGINYPIVMADSKITQAYGGIQAIPTTFVIDRHGRIVKHYLGYTSKNEFVKVIQPLLKP